MIFTIIAHLKAQYCNKPVSTLLFVVIAIFLCSAILHLGILAFDCNVTEIDDICLLTPGQYSYKVGTEGRWLNWLCFPILALYSVHVAQLFNAICLYVFSFAVLRQFLGVYRSTVFALVPLLFPAFCSLNYWPVTMVPSFLLIACAAVLHNKLREIYFFIIFGILINGGLNHFYFLLPLLFIRQDTAGCLRIILFWVMGFAIGYAVSNCVTYLHSGHAIQLDVWRNPHYIRCCQDVFDNINRSFLQMLNQVPFFGKPCALAFLLGIGSLIEQVLRRRLEILPALIVVTLVSCSIFASTLYAGVDVETRSIMCAFFGLMLFLVCCLHKKPVILACAIFLMSMQQYRMTALHMQHWNTIRHVWQEGLASIPAFPHEQFRLVMVSSEGDMNALVHSIQKTYRVSPTQTYSSSSLEQWEASARAIGFMDVNIRGREELKARNININNLNFCDSGCYLYVIFGNLLILQTQPVPATAYIAPTA